MSVVKKKMKKEVSKVSPLDVAAYIVDLSKETGEPITNMKLQKLVYYAYAWYAVEKGSKLFEEKIKAWKYGPVVQSVYDAYSEYGADVIKETSDGDPNKLDKFTKDLIDEVFNVYGIKTAIELMSLTHSEAPWRDSYFEGEFHPIPFDLVKKYYTTKKNLIDSQNGKEEK